MALFQQVNDRIFEEQGFPAEVCRAFQNTANETKMIVMSRVPGGNCTSLISDGYDLKGFFIKAKSCNWGPMAGFLCQMPPFNKKGEANLMSNAKANKEYFYIFNHIQKAVRTRGTPNNIVEQRLISKQPGAFKDSRSPFVHLKISEARKKELLDNKKKYCLQYTKVNKGAILGISWSKDLNVCMDFYLFKENKEWGLYHGNIFYKPEKDPRWRNFLTDCKPDEIFPYFSSKNPARHSNRMVLEKIIKKIGVETGDGDHYKVEQYQCQFHKNVFNQIPQNIQRLFPSYDMTLYPILGIMNPYPPYTSNGNRNTTNYAHNCNYYKNAVTGPEIMIFLRFGRRRLPIRQVLFASAKRESKNFSSTSTAFA